MRTASIVLLIFCARFLVAAWYFPPHGGPAQQTWLLKAAAAAAMRAHHPGYLAIAATLAAFGALLAAAYRAQRRNASTLAIVLTSLFAAMSMVESFGVRAQVFGWFFLSLLLLLLDLENAWIFLAIPLVALWANLHSSAIVAPLLTLVWSIGTLIEDRHWTPRVERNFVLTAGTAFALFLTPKLWNLPLHAVHLETPADLSHPAVLFGLLPLLGLCAYFGIAAPRERWRDGMLFAAACVIGFLALALAPFAALIVAPMAAQRFSAIVPAHARINVLLEEPFGQSAIVAASAVSIAAIVISMLHAPAIIAVSLR